MIIVTVFLLLKDFKKCGKRVTYIRQIRDLDDPLEELHFSGPVEKLREAAEEKRAEMKEESPAQQKKKSQPSLHRNPDDRPHE